jgi:hypothetical protein
MKKHVPLLSLLIIGSIFIFSFYGKAITNANSLIFNQSGDALKNYFTYAYHIEHDSSYLGFEGMNYPYGEHILYTDCHPALANTFKLLGSGFPFFRSHSIGILNLVMLFSIFFTFFVCYFLLQEFKINKWFAVLFSIGITLLAPQIFRMEGHLALSYSLAIPLSWLLLLKSFKSGAKAIFVILLFLNNVFWLFIHAYLGIIILFFLTAMLFLKIIFDKTRRQLLTKYLILLGSVLIPVIIFVLVARLTDNHIDRTNNPSGFFLHNAELDDVFLPHHAPFRPLLDKLTGNAIKQKWEAWSYVGLSTTILFIILIVSSVLRLFNRKKAKFLVNWLNDKTLNISLIAAFTVLLFAMAIPFKQIPSLLEYFPVLKQFRATGRFAWPFYFVAMVFSAYVFQDIFFKLKSKKKNMIAFSMVFLVGALNIIEAIPYHNEVSGAISKSPNLFRKELLPEAYKEALEHIKTENFQAILALPFFYIGSESYSRPRNEETVRASIVLSYHTGIPIVEAVLTRTSVSESKKIVQIVSPDFYEKPIRYDFPNDKPLLVIKTQAPLSKYENAILRKCKPLYSNKAIDVYSLELDDLFRNNSRTVYDKFLEARPVLHQRGLFYISDSTSFVYFNGFDKSGSNSIFRGNGAFESIKKGKNILAEFAPGTFSKEKDYDVSIWMYNGEPDALNLWFRFIIEEFDEANNKWYSTTIFPEHAETINGDWSLVEGVFKVRSPRNWVYVVTKGKENSKASFHADDLLIKEKGTDVFRLDDDSKSLFYNNHKIELH